MWIAVAHNYLVQWNAYRYLSSVPKAGQFRKQMMKFIALILFIIMWITVALNNIKVWCCDIWQGWIVSGSSKVFGEELLFRTIACAPSQMHTIWFSLKSSLNSDPLSNSQPERSEQWKCQRAAVWFWTWRHVSLPSIINHLLLMPPREISERAPQSLC